MFWLKKLVGFWLMPLPFSILLILAGLALSRFSRFRRTGRGLASAGLGWLLLCSNAGVGTWLVRGLENQYPSQPPLVDGQPPSAALARCHYVVVLGGGHGAAPERSANHRLSSSALARVVEGVRLARQLPHATLIVSGPPDARHQGPSHARLLADTAVSLGIARERIVEIDDARDTEREAAAVRRLVGGRPVALVTSAWHMPRALALCTRTGIDALACPADYAARDTLLLPAEFLYWNLGGLERSTKAVYENIGGLWARLRDKA